MSNIGGKWRATAASLVLLTSGFGAGSVFASENNLTLSPLGGASVGGAQEHVSTWAGSLHPLPTYQISPQRYHTATDLSQWLRSGNARFTPAGLRLHSERATEFGSCWHRLPLSLQDDFKLDVQLALTGPAEVKSSEGIALWLASEHSVDSLIFPPPAETWNLFGYRPNFKGVGIFLSTSDRSNNVCLHIPRTRLHSVAHTLTHTHTQTRTL